MTPYFDDGQSVIYCGAAEDVLPQFPSASADLVFTDPPYSTDAVSLYAAIAAQAARVLVGGGSFVAYTGQHNLPAVLAAIAPHLRYWWTIANTHDTGHCARMPGKWIMARWKPLVWFVKDFRAGRTFVSDVVSFAVPSKLLHPWEQSIGVARYLVGQLTTPDGCVLDPCMGSGTTIRAAKDLGRRAIGIERDERYCEIAAQRLAQGALL